MQEIFCRNDTIQFAEIDNIERSIHVSILYSEEICSTIHL